MGTKKPFVSARSLLPLLFFCLAIVIGAVGVPAPVKAADLPLAAGSPLAGFSFDDKPLMLPVQRNFQMAMLTASSELGRSCGRMEAYGWRMDQLEQQRVNTIFNSTVERLRGLGYSITAEAPPSISRDITMFSADRPEKHFLLMWSAGEIGLVMTLCESTPPAGAAHAQASSSSSMHLASQDVLSSTLQEPLPGDLHHSYSGKFTPVGSWVGSYTCEQGYTGGTLAISSLKGRNLQGVFRFYPTLRNKMVPRGSYTISGQYDAASERVVINPGKWIERPRNFYNTVIVGKFDPANRTFSAFFQGISGCTSFEARYSGEMRPEKTEHKKVHKVKAKLKQPAAMTPAVPNTMESPPGGSGADVPSISLPSAAPDIKSVPPSVAPPAPSPVPAGTTVPQKKSDLDQLDRMAGLPKPFMIAASGQYFTPNPPMVQPPLMVQPYAPQAPQAQIASPAAIYTPYAPEAPQPNYAPIASYTNATPNQVQPPIEALPAAQVDPLPAQAPDADRFQPNPPTVPQPQMVPQYYP